MKDNFNREITYIRISVIPYCNLNCVYCSVPKKDLKNFELLTVDEIYLIAKAAKELGIKKIRITGGEPLLRKDILEIVEAVKKAEIEEIVLTTNGILLENLAFSLKEKGLTRINVSLDSLNRETFKMITSGDLDKVLRGINKAKETGLVPIKINTVLLRGINDKEIIDIAKLSIDNDFLIRFIEYMPNNNVKVNNFSFISGNELIERVKKYFEIYQVKLNKNEVAKYYKIKESKGLIGIITPVTQHFCNTCNRIRITSEGKIYPCLFSRFYVDLKPALKGGSIDEIKHILLEGVTKKPLQHKDLLKSEEVLEDMQHIGG